MFGEFSQLIRCHRPTDVGTNGNENGAVAKRQQSRIVPADLKHADRTFTACGTDGERTAREFLAVGVTQHPRVVAGYPCGVTNVQRRLTHRLERGVSRRRLTRLVEERAAFPLFATRRGDGQYRRAFNVGHQPLGGRTTDLPRYHVIRSRSVGELHQFDDAVLGWDLHVQHQQAAQHEQEAYQHHHVFTPERAWPLIVPVMLP